MDQARLFQPPEGYRTAWSLRTTFGLNLLEAAELMALQYVDGDRSRLDWGVCQTALSTKGADCAFFYNHGEKEPGNRPDITGAAVRTVDLTDCRSRLHPLARSYDRSGAESQTFHAKVSLVCMEGPGGRRYRLQVGSKNVTRGPAAQLECAAVFDLLPLSRNDTQSEAAQANARELKAFFAYVFRSTDRAGRRWLHEHGLTGQLYGRGFRLQWLNPPLEGLEADRLWFGGVGTGELADKLGLSRLDPGESVVLTPPAFVQSQPERDYLKQNPILWDCRPEKEFPEPCAYSSHIKLYLLKLTDPESYRLSLGSANLTPQGVGVTFSGGKLKPAQTGKIGSSVECLVSGTLERKQFDPLKAMLEQVYQPFQGDFESDGSLKTPQADRLGAFLATASCLCRCTEVEYQDETGQHITGPLTQDRVLSAILYHFRPWDGAACFGDELPQPLRQNGMVEMPFWPVEYDIRENRVEVAVSGPEGRYTDFSIRYPVRNFQPTRGMVLAGTSQAVVELPRDPSVPAYVNQEAMGGLLPTFVTRLLREKALDDAVSQTGDELRRLADTYPGWSRCELAGRCLEKLAEQLREEDDHERN